MTEPRREGTVAFAAGHGGARHPRWAWLIHVFTALGVVAGMAALVSVFDGHARAAIGWLLVAAVIDGVDGPLARSFGVAEALPQIDGCVLDTVVDFVGCVVSPFAFLWRFEMLPAHLAFALVGFGFVTSALWFSRTDMMTGDNWFNGFPAAWNLVVPTLFLLGGSTALDAMIVTALAVLQLTSVKFVHPVRVARWRGVTLTVTIGWLAAIAVMTELAPQLPQWGSAALLAGPLYLVALSLRRTFGDHVPPAGTAPG